MDFWDWLRNPWLGWTFKLFGTFGIWERGGIFCFKLFETSPFQVCPDVAPGLNLQEFFMEFRAENLWEKDFSPGKNPNLLGLKRNSWNLSFFFFQRKKWILIVWRCRKLNFFSLLRNFFPIPNQNSNFKAALAIGCIPRVWEFKKKRELKYWE